MVLYRLKNNTQELEMITLTKIDNSKITINADEIIKFSDIAMYEAKRDKDTEYKFFNKSMLKRESDTSP